MCKLLWFTMALTHAMATFPHILERCKLIADIIQLPTKGSCYESEISCKLDSRLRSFRGVFNVILILSEIIAADLAKAKKKQREFACNLHFLLDENKDGACVDS